MIISHKHKYIFVKTAKVAGTSVEIFFEQLSFSKNVQKESTRSELIHKDGIIGFRGNVRDQEKQAPTWYHHIELPKIKKILDNEEVIDEYFKFSITRNPWDRVVSAYHHFSPETSFNEYIFCKPFPLPPITSHFKDYIDDVHFIRFENLKEDVEYVCKKLGLDYDMNNFGTYKTHIRKKSKHKHYTDYYDDETKSIVAEKFAKDIEYFNYEFGE